MRGPMRTIHSIRWLSSVLLFSTLAPIGCSGIDLRAGEFLTLLGPSGGGKSTALMMLAGFDTPTSGDILYKGQSIANTPAHRRNFGVVFQTRALFPHLTALQNVAYPLRMRGVPRAEATKRAREALARVHLAPLVGKRPARRSCGSRN